MDASFPCQTPDFDVNKQNYLNLLYPFSSEKKKAIVFSRNSLDFVKCVKLEKRLDVLCLHENYFILIDLVENVSVLHESSPKK